MHFLGGAALARKALLSLTFTAGTLLLVAGCKVSILEEEPAPVGTPAPTNAAGEEQPSNPTAESSENGEAATHPDYPKANLGWKVGNVIPNLAFEGYAPNESTRGSIALGDLHDPDGSKAKVIAVILSTAWDTYSAKTLELLEDAHGKYDVVTLSVLVEGAKAGFDASTKDLDAWHSKWPWAGVARDPGASSFSAMLSRDDGVPFIIFLDARTMTILAARTGGILTEEELMTTIESLGR